MCRVVSYYRVSTQGQGRSGLGLEAQRAAVEGLCASRDWTIIAEYIEVESAKRQHVRPKLDAALEQAAVTGSKLVVAKLDRLSRDAEFTLKLRNSGVDFTCADNPDVNRLTIGLLAVINEDERERISQRTKDALAAVKARGTWRKADGTPYRSGARLGNPNGAAAFRRAGKGNVAAVASVVENADAFARRLAPKVAELLAAGHQSLPALANALNDSHVQTPRGGKWYPSSVRNLLARIDGLGAGRDG